MIKRIIGILVICLGMIIGSYFSIYFSLIDNQTMLLVLALAIAILFVLGIFIIYLDSREKKLKKEKKILLEMIKKTRATQEKQNYSGTFDDLRRRKIY